VLPCDCSRCFKVFNGIPPQNAVAAKFIAPLGEEWSYRIFSGTVQSGSTPELRSPRFVAQIAFGVAFIILLFRVVGSSYFVCRGFNSRQCIRFRTACSSAW
jgi:hypothetical protein